MIVPALIGTTISTAAVLSHKISAPEDKTTDTSDPIFHLGNVDQRYIFGKKRNVT